ncbi:MAG: AAA family ATPase [Alphaproteobacteria bacterium]|nr:AAA family ATPase [Alphaproteobacteria bacterium]
MPNVLFGNGYAFEECAKFNILLGKNGSGKSTLLRELDAARQNTGAFIKYITPERGGELTYDGSVETSQSQNAQWLWSVRRKNQFHQFRQTSVSEFRKLETLVLRKIEQDLEVRADLNFSFESTIQEINALLDRIKIYRKENGIFGIRNKQTDAEETTHQISSGESELISLAIEILNFSYVCQQEDYREHENWLLLDEPDVHLHPDLQYRLMRLLVNSFKNTPGRVIIATHSTCVLSALINETDMRIAFLTPQLQIAKFIKPDEPLISILPVFGAHPLSSVFNEKPILIVEGEDDERVWQTAVRSSQGSISVYPCVAGDKHKMSAFEDATNQLISSVYEDAKAYSFRDRDDDDYAIGDNGCVVRARLNCYAIENLLLTNDVLGNLNTSWENINSAFEEWIAANAGHPQHAAAVGFRDDGWDRRNANIKPLRNVIMMLAGSNKPWEIAAGQAIADIKNTNAAGENSLRDFLGPKIIGALDL